jgi:GTP diphosphokinase / guanosine-3',5'-bis(diphosphate) 3'-diphosphatase
MASEIIRMARAWRVAAELQAQFGVDVADLVAEVTDDKQLTTSERKKLQVEHAGRISMRAKLLKLADKTSNLRSIANSPPPDWSLERKQEYLKWAREVIVGLRGANVWLEGPFDEAAKHLDQIFGNSTVPN